MVDVVGVVGAVDETFPDEAFCSFGIAKCAVTNGMHLKEAY